jgi:hypothetical protein
MHFAMTVMRPDGTCTPRHWLSAARARRRPAGARLVDRFRQLLDELASDPQPGVVRLPLPLAVVKNWALAWQPIDLGSALAALRIAGETALALVLLSGLDPIDDRCTVPVVSALLEGWRAGRGLPPGHGLRGLRERPLLVCLPWPGLVMEFLSRPVYAVAQALAAAFFERAAAVGAPDPSLN